MYESHVGTEPFNEEHGAGSSGAGRSSQTQRRRPYVRRCVPLLVALSFTVLAAGCFESKVVTSKVNDSEVSKRPTKMNGVFYALPRTVVKADVPVVRTNKQPGALSVYTPCFLSGANFVVKKGSEFAVDSEKIKFDTMSIPDTEEIYMVKTTGGMFETRNLELALTESGVLIKASADVSNDTIDIVTGAVKTGTGLLAKALPVFLADSGTLDKEQKDCRALAVDTWVEELELAGSGIIDANGNINEAALAGVQEIPDTLKNVGKFKDGYEKAKEIADQIDALETRRGDVVSQDPATAPAVRADTLKLVLDEVDKTVDDLKKTYFLGSESKITWNASFKLNPSRTKLNIDLFTLSKEHGVCEINVNQGVQLDPRFKIKKRCKGGAAACKPSEMEPVQCVGQKVRLEMALGEDGESGAGGSLFADKVKSAGLKQDGNRGFYYRIPGRAIAFITQASEKQGDKARELGRAPLSIAQFGEVVSLPASTGGRKTKYTLDLYESSGGMKNFVMGSEALVQQKNIDDLTGAASTAIEAKGERKKAKAPADELQQLERQRKILEEKKKIRDLENDLSDKPPGAGDTP